ncbi:polysaccharide deacetylase family protein [Sphingobium sp. HBC34]|uniref:Polysaccharide deacetylase family protein n=1 Tax=Sphingobium cyanobacteriorum TaxID=3063954 RepID=A0ABT8ZG26_9SPHN|nr:polysaccharide deacetylase family protein [Sphingobium sp. HBC34]MDO7833490.1 polysaccharide deacetylase family protein [Sphingobium sp. HBC34]
MTAPYHDGNLLSPPLTEDRITLDPAFGARFMLFVDTEEEFDWDAPFSRTGHGVTALAGMARGHGYFAAAGMKPVYVTDYPVIDDEHAAAMMRQWVEDGTADIGAHLHPWVNPPHVETVSAANSYVGFLPEEVERAKLEALCQRIDTRFGRRPIAYRAGRYGVGPNSARLLEMTGFRLDSSVRSRFDYSHQHGPDFQGMPLNPYWAGPGRSLIELPLSTAFAGLLRGAGERLYRAAQAMGPLAGALARARMLSRVPLTPEGVPAHEAVAAIDALLEEGVRVLNFSFHSPTLEPGHTPYVRDERDRTAFYGWWDKVLDHLARRGVQAATLDQFLAAVPVRSQACKAA